MKTRQDLARLIAILPLLLLSILFSFPVLWMVLASFKTDAELFRQDLIPSRIHGDYYRTLLMELKIPYLRQYWNTIWIGGLQTVGALLVSCMAGFVFGRYDFHWRRILYATALITIIVPRQTLAIPLFSWIHYFGLVDTGLAVVLPGLVSGIGVLFFTQMWSIIPEEYSQCSRSEGATEFQIFWLLLPLLKAGILSYALIHFLLSWHEHLIPLIMLNSPQQLTLSIALSALYSSGLNFQNALIMAGTTLSMIPVVIFYWLVRHHFQSALADLV